jgi:hypothetical protein
VTLAPADRVRRRQIRGAIAVAIVAAWGAALAGLVRRDILRTPAERYAEIALRVNPGNFFYEVARGNSRAGYASSTIDTTEFGDTLWIREEFAVEVPGTRGAARSVRRTDINLSRAFGLRGFIIDVDSADAMRRTMGQTVGDSVISIVTATDGVPADTQRIQITGPVLMPSMVPLAMMLAREPRVGRTSSFTTLDVDARQLRDVSLRIASESLFVVDDSARIDAATGRFVSALRDTVRAWRVVDETDTTAGTWLDAQGRIVERTSDGVRFRRMAYELSFENWRLDALATDTAGSANDVNPTPADPRVIPRTRAERLVARLTAPSLSAFDLSGGRQRISGNVLTVATEDSSRLIANYSFPPDVRFRNTHRDYLQAEPFLQTRAPAMLRLGIAIIKHEREPGAMVGLLTRWVADSVERTVQPGDPDAAVILQSRKADASGHAQLFTALARSLDIPTRLVSGALRIDGRFYFHTWAEVFLNDWVAVDPTYGQFPADANHLRLTIGGLERRSALRRNIRSLHIEVVEVR